MAHIYDNRYLKNAMDVLGEAADCASHKYGINPEEFFDKFSKSRLSLQFARGNPGIIAGRSGMELVMEMIDSSLVRAVCIDEQYAAQNTKEYRLGRAVAYYQWASKRPFSDIFDNITVSEILSVCDKPEQPSIEEICECLDEIINANTNQSRLAIVRTKCGYTQKYLSEQSGVKLGLIRQYEKGYRNINLAAVNTLIKLSNVLGCRVEDIVDYGNVQ